MFKLGAVALGTLLLISGNTVFTAKTANETEKEIYYQDSPAVNYGETGSGPILENETIYYSSRTLDTHTLAIKCPAFNYTPASGSCGAIGGGNLIGYYDRYDENLIPNHVSGRPLANTYYYYIEDAAVQAVIRELYDYMGTTTSGTTEKQFKNGIVNFCADKGHSVVFSSCMQGSTLSYSKAKSYLDKNQPIVLFLSGYNVIDLNEYENEDIRSIYLSEANHIMISFGYKTYVYDGNKTYNYFSVSSGIATHSSGVYDINYKTKINNALAVNIS